MIYKINSFWLNEIWFIMIQGIEMCIFIVTINIFLYKFIKQYNEFIFSVFSFVLNIILLSVQFSSSVVSNSLRRHGLQHAGLPCLSPTSGAYSNSCPLSQWCHPTISSSIYLPCLLLPSIFPSIRVFSKESVLRIRWPKYWSFSFRISPSNEYSGLISFRVNCFDLLAVQGTHKSLLQHHSSKASIR